MCDVRSSAISSLRPSTPPGLRKNKTSECMALMAGLLTLRLERLLDPSQRICTSGLFKVARRLQLRGQSRNWRLMATPHRVPFSSRKIAFGVPETIKASLRPHFFCVNHQHFFAAPRLFLFSLSRREDLTPLQLTGATGKTENCQIMVTDCQTVPPLRTDIRKNSVKIGCADKVSRSLQLRQGRLLVRCDRTRSLNPTSKYPSIPIF